jgi:hypothetical protein
MGVFIDYQNVYRRGRCAFALPGDPHWVGQIDSLKVGNLLAAKAPDTTLELVRIYRGLPDGAKDPKGNAACSRQVGVWKKLPRVEVFTRPLRYPANYPAEKPTEKGPTSPPWKIQPTTQEHGACVIDVAVDDDVVEVVLPVEVALVAGAARRCGGARRAHPVPSLHGSPAVLRCALAPSRRSR